jgi:hypothetical protein
MAQNEEPVEIFERNCAYVETLIGYGNQVLEFPCRHEATHGLYCDEHACFDREEIDNVND